MKRTLLVICLQAINCVMLCAQSSKSTEDIQQVWLGYFNQARFSNKWGMWTDLHLRTKEDFTNNFSQAIIRLGLTYYLDNNTKLTAGYARVFLFPGDNHKQITQPEHRPWQQLQWHTSFTRTRLMQWIRLEERFRSKIANDSTLADGYNFNWRLRYNIWYEVPLVKNGVLPGSLSFIANDELHINFGKEIINNYFDQNRFFLGLKYQAGKSSNIQFGYMNLFQQLSAGNRYKNIHAARIFFFQNFDLRKRTVQNK
jgi:Protein of unknown function (DUF2490)